MSPDRALRSSEKVIDLGDKPEEEYWPDDGTQLSHMASAKRNSIIIPYS